MLTIPSRIETASFLQIHQSMAIISHKEFPPYLAHQEISESLSEADIDDRSIAPILLGALDLEEIPTILEIEDVKPIVLDEVRLFKSEVASLEFPQALAHRSNSQRGRDSAPEFRKVIERGMAQPSKMGTVPTGSTHAAITILGDAGSGRSTLSRGPESKPQPETHPGQSEIETAAVTPAPVPLKVVGTLSMKDLGLTNDHAIEIRRIKEGVVVEQGTVDIQKGIYSIVVNDFEGLIQGRLLDRNGRLLGYAEKRILISGHQKVNGPSLVLEPSNLVGTSYDHYDGPQTAGISSLVANSRGNKNKGREKEKGNFLFFHGTEKAEVNSGSAVQDDRVGMGSRTLLSIETKDYPISQRIVTAGEKFQMPLLPPKMVSALREMVSDQRRQDLNDPNGTLIWGQVKIDGMPISGVSVEVESFSEAIPIYMNEFFLPDPSLKATSTNGYFAFLQVEPGFQSLLAKRGETYFSHDNLVVQKGTISLAVIENSYISKTSRVRTFDAFSGKPVDMNLEMQSLDHEIITSNGISSIILPDIHRMSLINVRPVRYFVPGVYQYDDKSDLIDLPLLQEDWLENIRNRVGADRNLSGNAGIIVGFVSDEDFDVYPAVESKDIYIVFFDRSGQVVPENHGVSGGGYIMFNVSPGTNEAVIYGRHTQKLYSQVVAVDAGSVNVLTHHSEF